MISGKQQGRFLAIISKLLSPKNILEIGTFTGYATLCLAEGLAENGKITTLDINEELSYLPKKYFAESDFAEKINFCLQDGREFLQNTDEMYDLVFIDGNKAAYVDYLTVPKQRRAARHPAARRRLAVFFAGVTAARAGFLAVAMMFQSRVLVAFKRGSCPGVTCWKTRREAAFFTAFVVRADGSILAIGRSFWSLAQPFR